MLHQLYTIKAPVSVFSHDCVQCYTSSQSSAVAAPCQNHTLLVIVVASYWCSLKGKVIGQITVWQFIAEGSNLLSATKGSCIITRNGLFKTSAIPTFVIEIKFKQACKNIFKSFWHFPDAHQNENQITFIVKQYDG